MPFARYNEFAPTGDRGTPTYDALQEKLGVRDNPPDGLVFHSAGFSDDGTFRLYEVWESREQAERFVSERILPAIQEITEGAPHPPEVQELYELHNFYAG